jgi:hypothetical protein
MGCGQSKSSEEAVAETPTSSGVAANAGELYYLLVLVIFLKSRDTHIVLLFGTSVDS